MYWQCYCVASCNRYLMLIAPHVFFYGATYRCTVYHGTAAISISIELYEIVQLRSGDCVVYDVDVVVDRWRCRPDVEGGSAH